MSFGVPVVSFDCPNGPREIIDDGIDGLLVENGNVNALSAAIMKMIADQHKRKRMGRAAIQNIIINLRLIKPLPFGFLYYNYMKKVSVITPIYNVEHFIAHCVVTLMQQTLDEVEYIFVNDATPDNSIRILKKLLKIFQRNCHKLRF